MDKYTASASEIEAAKAFMDFLLSLPSDAKREQLLAVVTEKVCPHCGGSYGWRCPCINDD